MHFIHELKLETRQLVTRESTDARASETNGRG